ncbi:hypothetical protein VCUG_00583 [Vavraia culicis subsp. floridensis]|uniref:Uncharacterized protein n=1 Tax=Vavraia culicis (isolate floridensis) TaxID=948595 RepID=L2GY35_VAVCU|nr:uncharacterized protein VCUG_00583 [Vavraia culicis subsp. floridensis]ELA48000.1 hypothetical protein VCUG_00583 [Vavraia culicis subsp. floridensis]
MQLTANQMKALRHMCISFPRPLKQTDSNCCLDDMTYGETEVVEQFGSISPVQTAFWNGECFMNYFQQQFTSGNGLLIARVLVRIPMIDYNCCAGHSRTLMNRIYQTYKHPLHVCSYPLYCNHQPLKK